MTSIEVSLGKLVEESRASYSYTGVGHIFVHSAFCRYHLAEPLTEFSPSITAGTSPPLGLYLPRNNVCGCHRGNFKRFFFFLYFFKRNLGGGNLNCPQMSYSGLITFFSPGCNEIQLPSMCFHTFGYQEDGLILKTALHSSSSIRICIIHSDTINLKHS